MINMRKPNTKNQSERNFYKFFIVLWWWVSIQIGLSSNTTGLLSEGARFESLLRHWIFWLRLLEVFLGLLRKVRERYLKVCCGQPIRQVLQLRHSMNQYFPARFPQNIFRGKASNREANKKKFEIPRRISKSRQIAWEFFPGNSQHLNNLCALPKSTFVLFCWVSVNSIIFCFIAYVFVSSFHRAASPVATERLPYYQNFLYVNVFTWKGSTG
jgi:hypothetical protein